MSCQIEILLGPAGSGKTDWLIEHYQKELVHSQKNLTPGSALWISPSMRSRNSIRNKILNSQITACFSPNIVTFDTFAEKILLASSSPINPITQSQKRILLQEVIRELNDKQPFSVFGPIINTSGFLDLMVGFLSEVKRDEVWPEQFLEACEKKGLNDKDRELASIYEEYQKKLLALQRYDSEGRFWSARELIDAGQRKPFENVQTIVVDGFTDFTRTQFEILSQLTSTISKLQISFPTETDSKRKELFAKSNNASIRLIQNLSRSKNYEITTQNFPIERNQKTKTAFDHIEENIFLNPHEVTPSDSAKGIEILAVTGISGEAEVLAHRVKTMIQKGVRPDQIVIVFRSISQEVEPFLKLWSQANIPWACELDRRLDQTPLVRAILNLLQMELEDWKYDQLASVLHSNYFQPGQKEVDKHAIQIAMSTLRRLEIPSSRATIIRSLQNLVDHSENIESESSSSEFYEDAKTSLAVFSFLSQRLKDLRKKHHFSAWVDILISLTSDLGFSKTTIVEVLDESNQNKTALNDTADWDLLIGALRDASRFLEESELEESRTEKLTLQKFLSKLKDFLGAQTVSSRKPEQGRVRILSADQVRNLDIDHLILAGLTENSFPNPQQEDCIYSDADRLEFDSTDLSLVTRSQAQQDEMLLFYGVVTRARESLTLCYPATTSKGQPLFPSPYVTAIKSLFTKDALQTKYVGNLDPIADRHHALTDADRRILAVSELQNGKPGLFSGLLESPKSNRLAINLLASSEMAQNRFETDGFTHYEGMISSESNLQKVRANYGPNHLFSSTQLEEYANCPFKFLSHTVHKLNPVSEPVLSTDHRKRGNIIHDALAELQAVDLNSTELATAFQKSVEEKLNRSVTLTELQKSLNQIEMRLLSEWADRYAYQTENYGESLEWDSSPETQFQEASFGEDVTKQNDNEKITYPPLKLGSKNSEVKIQGRIDRIDVGKKDDTIVFNVVDYKTGKIKKFNKDLLSRNSHALQLALYTLAVVRLQLLGEEAVPHQMGFWSFREAGFVPGITRQTAKKPIPETDFAALETLLEELIPNLASGIRNGNFPVYNPDSDCTQYCDFKWSCRVNEIRPIQETRDKTYDVTKNHEYNSEQPQY